jgi:hypothetical protein
MMYPITEIDFAWQVEQPRDEKEIADLKKTKADPENKVGGLEGELSANERSA